MKVKDLLTPFNYSKTDELKIVYYEGNFTLYEGTITDEPQIDKKTLEILNTDYWSQKDILGEQEVVWWQINELDEYRENRFFGRHRQKLVIHCR